MRIPVNAFTYGFNRMQVATDAGDKARHHILTERHARRMLPL